MKVSIIIPCYNAEKYIRRCIDSILNQTYENWELIIVDDGSNDKSFEILSSYKDITDKLILIKQKNAGPSVARNNAIKKITGEYVIFIDIDDYIDNHMIEKMIGNAIEEDSDIITCGYYEIMKNKQIKINNFCNSNEFEKKIFFINKVLLTSGGVVWAKMYKSNIVKKVLFNKEYSMCEDQLFNMNIVKYCNKVSFMNGYYYYYCNDNNGSLSKKINFEFINNQLKISEILRENLLNIGIDIATIDNLIGKRLYIHIYNYIEFIVKNEKNKLENIREISTSLKIVNILNKSNIIGLINKIIKWCIVNDKNLTIIILIKFLLVLRKMRSKKCNDT